MNKETAFLNCYMISVDSLPCTDDDFHLVEKIYFYNSLESNINFEYVCIQIPQHEILNINLLDGLDYDIINKFHIPLIKRVTDEKNESWEIDLKYYEHYKLQPTDV